MNTLIAINYHYVRPAFDQPYSGIHGVQPGQLERQLKLLGQAGEFVDLARIRRAIDEGAPLPDRAILVTFDDGLREQYEHAWPILDRLGIPAAFFVTTTPIVFERVLKVHKIHLLRARLGSSDLRSLLEDESLRREDSFAAEEDPAAQAQYPYDTPEDAALKFMLNFSLTPVQRDSVIDRCFGDVFHEATISRDLYLSVDQIAELGGRGWVGSHAHDHLPLGLLPARVASELIAMSVRYLTRWTGYHPFALSYPYGSREACSIVASRAAARWGITFALTMERAANRSLRQPLHLARFDCNDVPGGKNTQWSIDSFFADVPSASWYKGFD